MLTMSCIHVSDYTQAGWAVDTDLSERSRYYCDQLEQGKILFFSKPPFLLSDEDRAFLVSRNAGDSRLHKNISYRPTRDVLRGFSDGKENSRRLHRLLRDYSRRATEFISRFLVPYAGYLQLDYASFRPLEEKRRDLPLHKRNDLLHVDAFPSRPTRGGRILRVFTNVNPSRNREWLISESFRALAEKYALKAGIQPAAAPRISGPLKRLMRRFGLPVTNRSSYDRLMLRLHDFLKENTAYQETCEKERLEFPPLATWLVFTDGIAHAALSGQYAIEQTFVVPIEALVTPKHAPIRVLEAICGRALA
jgi:3-deoxy-D-manno-octulosonic acid hydroxylase-like protein